MKRIRTIEELASLRERLREGLNVDKRIIRLCCGTGCIASGSIKVLDVLKNEVVGRGVDAEIVTTGCQGLCQKGPLMIVEPDGYFYQRVQNSHIPKIISNTIVAGFPVRELLYRDSIIKAPLKDINDVPFYKKQMRVVLRNNGRIDPTSIHHYIAAGGYKALEKALSSMSPDDVLAEVDRANLRGRGGAGFPTGKKWRHAKNATSKIKFVIANGDEGDPGAFMDRSLMEGDPHSVLEGMILCAYTIGARYGLIYVRHEYPLAVENLTIALTQARELGLLGADILGRGFSFNIFIRQGAGAFVCGEETALMASIMGERGFPRQRPPYPAEEGVWSFPTCINNVETLANVPYIITYGGEDYAKLGTERSTGTKVFALTGKVKNTGLLEVPMGITLREIIFDIGGGILGDKKFKAVQTGGPSGGCIPAEHLDLPVDFDSLASVGSMMGSGGMVVMDEDNCMVDVAKFFLSFTQSESCGKCPPCRIGTYQMLEILKRIASGEGQDGDIERLEELGKKVVAGSLCGLGTTAPNPVLTTIKYFREEYEEHIYDKYCRAKVCSGLGVFRIEHDECFLCGLCKQACAFDAVKEFRNKFFIDEDYCTKCKACYIACPIGAVKIEKQKRETEVGKI